MPHDGGAGQAVARTHPPNPLPSCPPTTQPFLSSDLPARVTIVDVGPRDGLQNEATPVGWSG